MSPLHNAEMISPATDNPPESPIALQWQHLASMDRQSPDFLPLLSTLTAGDNRLSTAALRDNDAEIALSVMDELFISGKIPSEHGRDTLHAMRALAYNSGQVPPRYQVNRHSLRKDADVIANGAFADVRKGRLGGKTVAIRTLRIDRSKVGHSETRKHFCKESILWMNVSHPHLLQLIAVDINPDTGQYSMISEMMMNGNIREYTRNNSTNRHRLLEEAATGLRYLHKREIIHGDVKGYNILLTNETPPRACLADFGLSTLTPGGPRDAETVTVGGTPIYMAPELLSPIRFGKSSSRPTQPADIYAFGMVIYEVLTGFQPFHEQKRGLFDLTYHIAHGLRPARPDNVEQVGFGDGTWELVEECWMGEATRRPTIEQVLAHLKCVAAFSMVVDPTPEIPHESIENSRGFDSCSQIQLFMSTVATVQLPTDPVNLANRDTTVATVDAGSPARSLRSTVSRTARSASPVSGKKTPPSKARPFNTIPAVRPGSKTSVGIMLVSAALSSMILVPSKDDKTRIRLPGSTRAITRRRKTATTFADQSGLWEAELANFLRVCEAGDIPSQRRQAQGFADKLDATLDNRDLHIQIRKEYLKSLRKLCYIFCILPSSFTLAPRFIKCEASPFALGGFSDVYEATLKGHPVVIKTLRVTTGTDHKKAHRLLVKEVVSWKWLQHENILPFLGITSTPPRVSIVSERMKNGNIMDFIRACPNHNRLGLLAGAVAGLEYLHKHDIIHGDLKGGNILIDSECRARLADFGLAVIIDESTTGSAIDNRVMRGTTRWKAPELLHPEGFGFGGHLQKHLPSASTDIWAIGMTILEVLTGCRPFDNFPSDHTVVYKVVSGDRPDRSPTRLPDMLWELLLKTWDIEGGPETRRRPSASIVLDQLKEGIDQWGGSVIPIIPRQWEECVASFDGANTRTEVNEYRPLLTVPAFVTFLPFTPPRPKQDYPMGS